METLESSAGYGDERARALERMLDELRQESEVAHVLLGLAGALAEVRTLEETLEKAVHVVPELFGAHGCLAATWDPADESLTVRASAGFERPERLQDVVADSPVVDKALTDNTPLFVAAAAPGRRAPVHDEPSEAKVACIVIPLSRWGERFGVLHVELAEPRPVAARDQALARGVARQVGVALANARRFGLLRDLRAFGLRVGSKLRLNSVVADVAAGAAELLSGDGAAFYFLESSSALVLAGATGLRAGLAEAVARIELHATPWSGLLESTVLSVPDLSAVLDTDDCPESAVGVPVPGGDTGVLGAIVVFFERPFRMGPDEAEAVSVLAAQASTAVLNANRFERQRRVAASLQRGLLAIEVPPMEDWRVGTVYEPAGGEADVGGDFFDVFDAGEGRVALSVGDVSGKGAEAAAGTAMAKYMLRAFAMRNASPASVLFHLNNALVQSFDDDSFATLVFTLFDPSTGACLIAAGGHPPPLVYRAASGGVEAVNPRGTVLGAFEGQSYDQEVVTLGSRDVLLAYTDGLTEARRGDALYGRGSVAASLARHGGKGLAATDLARHIFEDARAFGDVFDDTIVFVLAGPSSGGGS
jgi:serine phosphatase RsbU (regulator of sigma subunit)